MIVGLLACTTAFAVAEELPGAADIREGLEQLEREEAQRRLQLEAPAPVQARQASRLAYTDHDSPAAAAALVRSVFADQLAAMNQDPARFLSDAVIEANLGATTARVSLDRGEALFDGGIPLKTEDELGRLRPVDLTLQQAEDGYVLANPLVDLSISTLADAGIEIAVSGGEVGIRPAGVDATAVSKPFGPKDVLFPSVQTDRDLLVSPISRGVELSDQLRSVNSPEALRYEVDLPDGATLRGDGNGGAEIVRGDEALLRVPFPTAVDAQGSAVPVKLTVEGDSMILRISHRARPVAYPVLVDPVFELVEGWNWLGGANLEALSDGSWQWGSNVGWIHGKTSCINTCWGSGRGLFVSTPNGAFGAGQFGQWTYTPPGGTSYVTGAALHAFFRNNHNCSKAQAPQPHDYDGLWSPSGWNVLESNRANDFGNAQLSGAGKVLVVGLGTGNAGANSCWRDIVLGGATVWITDPDNPSWNGAPGIADSWTDTAVQPISVSASDPGLGVKYFNLFTTDGSGNPVSLIGNAVHPCTGLHASPCPGAWSTQVANYNPAVLPTGILPLALRAYDPLPDTHFAGQAVFLKVDHKAPAINLSGDLLSARPIKYHLEVEAEDGSAAALSSAQSGMKKIDFFLDGVHEGTFPPEPNPPACFKLDQGINVGSCKFKDIVVDLPRRMEGKHSLKLVATDSLGHQTTRTLALDLSRDTSPPELVASGPLRPQSGREIGPNGLTLSVHAKDLETGVAEARLFVDGEEVAQPVEQECELGGCDLDHTFEVSLEGYEHGLHDVKVIATDAVGNSTRDSWTVRLDSRAPTLSVSLEPNPAPETPGGWFRQPIGLPVSFTASDNGGGTPGSGIAKVETVQPVFANPQTPLVLFSGEACGSTESPCPQEAQGKKGLHPVFVLRQGEFEVPVRAYDAAGNVTTKTVTLRLDHDPPNPTVSGPIFKAPPGTPVSGNSEVDLSVTDKGGGIKELEVFVDGNVVQTLTIEEIEADGGTQTCSGETCTFEYSFVPDVGDSLSSGIHSFKVRAKDRANHTGSRTREMTFDSRPPTLNATPVFNPAPETPGGWFPQPFSVSVGFTASDNGGGTPGSGIAKVETVQPFVTSPQPLLLFSGEACGSTESPCPQEAQGKKGIGTVAFMRQGEFEVPVRAYDLAGNVTTETVTLRIDRGPPNLAVKGPIFSEPADSIVGAGTELDLSVTDKGGGIGSIEVLIDEHLEQTLTIEEMEADGGTQTCSGETCTFAYSFVPDVGELLPSGMHSFKVRAKDRAGHTGSRTREMTFDTHSPELTFSGPLANSAGKDLEAPFAELEITASDADAELPRSGIQGIDVTVDGEQVASLNCPGGSCAEPARMSYTYSESEWGTGPHEVGVVAFDRAGNTLVRRLMVNESITAVAPVCPTGEEQVFRSRNTISASEASEEIEGSVPSAVVPTEPLETEAGKADKESPFDPSVEGEGTSSINEQGFDVAGAPMGGGIQDVPTGTFTVGQAVCLRPLQTTPGETKPMEVGGDALIYANSAPSTDTVVRPTAFGTTIVQHLRGPEALTEFSWEIGLEPGEELRELSNGSVAVVGTGDLDLSDSEIPPEAASLDPLDIADVDSQLARAGASLAEANNEIEGEVVTVFSAPTVVKANGSTRVGLLKISGGAIVTASLPPEVVDDTIAMIIDANTSPDPVAMCAHVFADTPNLYSDGCREPADPNAEPAPSAEEGVRFNQLKLAALPAELRADFATGLDSGLGATASSGSPDAGDLDRAWCISHFERGVYCSYFSKDKDYAVSMEHRLFNLAETDNTKANAFRHALWVSAMINSAPPDIEALRFASFHERGSEGSPNRGTRYRSYMDGLNNFTAWVYAGRRGRSDQESCEHFMSKVGSALFIGFDQNPVAWANRVGFQQNNLVYRRKLEQGVRVHLVSQDCG